MSKKAILSTLLISSALLGTTAAANAATSAVKPESKLVTVSKDGAKLYKNSKLEESKKAKKGTVYKVDGYRIINKKHYYRVYQQDTKGENVYKGYLLDKDAKDLKGQKPAKKDRLVALTKGDQTAWKNLYFNIKIKDYDGTKHSSNFEVKTYYEINGKKYLSLYRGDKWMGYMNGDGFKVLTPEKVAEDKQNYEVEKDYDTYNDIYFTKKGQLKVGEKVKVKNIYTFGTGRKYGSLYNEDGKWIGYANMNALKEIEATKPEDEALKKAKGEANKAIEEAQKILDKAQASKESKEAAQKVIDAAKKTVEGDNLENIQKIPAEIKKAMEGLKEGVTSSDIEDLQNAIKDAEEVVKNDSALTGVDKVKEALDAAKKVLDAAKKGDATPEQIKDAVKNIQDTIKAVKVNKADLEKEIKEVEDLAKQVYLTKDQEDQLNKALDAVKKVADDLSKENIDAVKKAQETLVKAKEGLQKQPGYKEGEALSKALQNAQKLDQYGDILFQNFDQVEKAYKDAEDTMKELKKDPQAFGSTNTADKPLTAEDVDKVTKALNDALNNLLINAENTKWFYDEAKKAIAQLDPADQAEPNKALGAFETAAKKGAADNYKEIIDTAKEVVKTINDAQNKELQAVIDKADKIIKENDEAKPGNQSTEGQDFYTEATYKKFKDVLEEAKKALALQISDINKDNLHDKQITENALKKAIDGLKIAHWKSEEKDGKIILTEYTPIESAITEHDGVKYYNDKIVIPGKLKGMPVEVDINVPNSSGDLYPIVRSNPNGRTPITAQNTTVTFKAVDGQKVTTGENLYGTFAYMGAIDVTGLDTSNVKSFFKAFCGSFGTEIKGIEGLNTSKATDFTSMFADARELKSLDLSQWDMSNAKKINSMFFDTPKLNNLDLGGWNLKGISTQFPQDKVFGKHEDTSTFCGVIKITEGASTNKEKVKIEGLTFPTDSHSKTVIDMALDQSITGDYQHTKPTKPSTTQKQEATSNKEVQK